MTPDALLDAIRAAPDDPAPQLVLADWLLERGDPRGELIILDNAERDGNEELAVLERLLLLSAVYTFPCSREPDESTLPFVRGRANPMRYWLDHGGDPYEIRYWGYALWIAVDGRDVSLPRSHARLWTFQRSHEWDDHEAAATLAVISDAIRYGTPLASLWYPHMAVPSPSYASGARRVYPLPIAFCRRRGIDEGRHGLAARDHERWLWIWRRVQLHTP